ncbi:MAG: VWA domain-containing protein [Alistipes sp.]|nr:VWA domain-containing protein [Alistipes sp.]
MYQQDITRTRRTAFVVAIDHSLSMQEEITFGGMRMPKSHAVAIATNRLLDELVLRSTRDGQVRNYYDVAVVGYSNDRVYSMFGEQMSFISVERLAALQPPRMTVEFEWRLPSGSISRVTEEIPEWIEPRAGGSTPMVEMFQAVALLVEQWCANPANRESFPPMVINITDGTPDGGSEQELIAITERIRSASTSDGGTLLFNIHIGSDGGTRRLFPRKDELEPRNRSQYLMAKMSSTIPATFEDAVTSLRGDLAHPPFLAMGYNASMVEVIAMLNIGSYSIVDNK